MDNLLMDQKVIFDAASKSDVRQPGVVRAQTSGAVEWYTPSQYIEAARRVMGGIDCDPASSAHAQEIVKADVFWTIDDDGLRQIWGERVWLNPPYAARLINKFVEALLGKLSTREVKQAVLLTHNQADTAWWHMLAQRASCIVNTRGRVKFYNQNGVANSPTHGHAFFYFGRRWKAFRREFDRWGTAIVCDKRSV